MSDFRAKSTMNEIGLIFITSLVETHANEFLRILTTQLNQEKGIVFVTMDNGSDWNFHLIIR